MNKNIIIIILSAIIILLVLYILNPTVVTSRKIQKNTQEIVITTPTTEIASTPTHHHTKRYTNSTYSRSIVPAKSSNDTEIVSDRETPIPPAYKKTQPVYSAKTYYPTYEKQEYKPTTQNYQTERYNIQPHKIQNTQSRYHTVKPKQNTLESSIKTCKPYSEKMNTEYMGMNMVYLIEILGWQNNKCVLNFTSEIDGAGASFENEYGVNASDVQIVGFAPKIRCEFTKDQLKYVGDSVLQEEERNNGAKNNMLKNPNDINFTNFSSSDVKLLQVIMNDRACEVVNLQDLNKMFEGLFDMFQ